MPRPGLSRLQPLRKLISCSSACSQAQAAGSSHSLSNLKFHRSRALALRHEDQEARLRFFSGSVSGSLSFCRTFSVSRMELEKLSLLGTGDAIGEEDAEMNIAQEAVGLRSGDVSDDEQVSLESVEEDGLVSESAVQEQGLDEEAFSCEGVEEGFQEDAEPHEDPEGRSYLHVLTMEEVQRILEKTRADDVQVIPVRDLCEWADNLIIASGHSSKHLMGIADAICFEVKKRSTNVSDNMYPTVEGRESEEWMVVDCGSIVVHVFREDIRGEYNLEEMWRKRRPINIKDIGL